MALRPCRQPGCPELVKQGYCTKHYREPVSPFKKLDIKKSDDERSFYSSAAWTRTSKLFRIKHPLCNRCYGRGIVQAAECVHHVVPMPECKSHGINPLSWSNLEALCNRCHLEDLRQKKR